MVSASETDRDFYAVRPELVLRASELFAVSSSMLDRGAKRLHSRAVAIRAGKESGHWGRHQRSVIAQFCEYTQSGGNRLVLPWQELVEHHGRYDGEEGISSRTGNRPLSTVMRMVVDADAFRRARSMSGLSLEALSESSRLPIVLLGVIETGEWPDVAESTATTLADCLGIPKSELFANMDPHTREPVVASDQAGRWDGSVVSEVPGHRAGRRVWVAGVAVLAAGAVAVIYWTGAEIDPPANDTDLSFAFVNTLWKTSITVANRNIPVTEDTVRLFSNGGYLEFKERGVIAFNWADPGNLVPLPGEFSWQRNNGQLSVVLNSHTYEFDVTEGDDSLVALDTTRSFEMTLHRIHLGGADPAAVPAQHALVGCWRWSNGSLIIVDADGFASNGAVRAPWAANADGSFEIDWPDLTGSVTLSSDGQSLDALDSLGVGSTAQRFQGSADGFVGKWRWDNGGVVDIEANGAMSLGNLQGTWSGSGRDYRMVWPLIDEGTVSLDGNSLSGRNQYGQFRADKQINCL